MSSSTELLKKHMNIMFDRIRKGGKLKPQQSLSQTASKKVLHEEKGASLALSPNARK